MVKSTGIFLKEMDIMSNELLWLIFMIADLSIALVIFRTIWKKKAYSC